MGTRSAIAVVHGDNYKGIYVHYDGYLKGVGATLLKHYDSAKANELVALGDASVIGPNIGVKHAFDVYHMTKEELAAHEAEHDDSCTFYGRDRGEENTGFETSGSYTQFYNHFEHSGCEYFYVMKDGEWYVSTDRNKNLTKLSEALAETEEA